jgi:hypothetical protein
MRRRSALALVALMTAVLEAGSAGGQTPFVQYPYSNAQAPTPPSTSIQGARNSAVQDEHLGRGPYATPSWARPSTGGVHVLPDPRLEASPPSLSTTAIDALALGLRRAEVLRTYEPDRAALLASIRRDVARADAADRAVGIKRAVETFAGTYSVLRRDAAVAPFLERLTALWREVDMLDAAARRARDADARLAILTREQKLPPAQRSPFAHPSVLEENLRINAAGRERAMTECDALLAAVRRSIARLDGAAAD